MTANKNILNTNNGGVTAKSLSIPQLDPIFSYTMDGSFGIYIYVVKTKLSAIAIATFNDSITEVAYSMQPLASGSKYEVIRLLKCAEEEFNDNDNNPFHTLLWDFEAFSELCKVIQKVVKGE